MKELLRYQYISIMFKSSIVNSSYEKTFIRDALLSGLRLDGRAPNDSRSMEIQLSRQECSSVAEVQVGETRVICVVKGAVVAPFPDRPTEGTLLFSVEFSNLAETNSLNSISANELTRFLERSIKESEAIDLESLCIISGEKVWCISCDVRVIDASGGNIVDSSLFAAMGALRSFRKPELTIESLGYGEFSNRNLTKIIIHSSKEREPLQLALHHVPLSASVGIFKIIINDNGDLKKVYI